jgi:hypothetical protein
MSTDPVTDGDVGPVDVIRIVDAQDVPRKLENRYISSKACGNHSEVDSLPTAFRKVSKSTLSERNVAYPII